MKISTLKITLLSLAMITWLGQEVLAQASNCFPNNTRTGYASIYDVQVSGGVTGFQRSSSSGEGYVDLTGSHSATVTPGSFSLYMRTSSSWNTYAAIDWNDNGSFSDPIDYFASFSGSSNTTTVNVPAVAGFKRMRIISDWNSVSNACNPSSYSEVEDYQILVAVDDNASLKEVVTPNFVYCSPESKLSVRVGNTGKNQLTSFSVGGEIRSSGILGRIPLTPDTFNVSLNPFTGDTIVDIYDIGSTGFSLGDTIITWTFNPNAGSDNFTGDDTTMIVLRDGLKGVFTVGDTSQGYDIPTLDSVVRLMNARGAVCDTTIFILQDKTFPEQIELPSLIGSSVSAPIIFRGESDTSETVIESGLSSGSSNDYVVLFDGLDHVFMENITIKNTAGSNYRTAVLFDSDCEWIMFDNMKFVAENSNSSAYAALVSNYDNQTDNTTLDHLTISNSVFEGGSRGIYMDEVGNDIKVINSVFSSQVSQSYEFYDVDNVEFVGNETKGSKPSGYHGDFYRVNGLKVTNNVIHPGNSNNSNDAWYFDQCNGTASNPVLIANNMISHGQKWATSAYSAIYLNNCYYVSILNNSILTRYNEAGSFALEVSYGGAINVYNNNIIQSGIGTPIYYDGNANIAQSDYNNIFTRGAIFATVNGTPYTSLSAYQSGSSFDMNSISVDPAFYEEGTVGGYSNLHVCNEKLDGAGIPVAAVTEDLDGDLRSLTNPDIGADEFFGLDNLDIGADYGICQGDSTTITYGAGVAGDIPIWNGVDTTNALTVNQPGIYSISLINECGIAQDTIEILTPAKVDLPNDTTICAGTTLSVDASITNGASYTWSSSETSPIRNINSAGTYIVTATDKWGCTSNDNFDLSVAKVASLDEDRLTVCAFDNIELEVDDNPSGSESYNWSWANGNGNATSATIFELAQNFNATDTIVVSMTASGCTTYDTALVRVIEEPSASFTDSVTDFVYDVLTNNSVGDVHMWDFGDGNTSTQKLPSHLYRKGGIYNVTYTVSQSEFDCGEETATSEINVIPTDVSEVDADAQVLIYPNPNNGSFVINMTDLNVEQAEVNVLDMKGSVIYTAQPTLTGGNASLQVDLSNVEAGMYIVSMKLDGKVVTERISVQ